MNPIKHVAIIMDGNGRWGIKHKKSRNLGHRAGLSTVEKILKETIKNNIKFLTLFAFSTENWKRPKKEVNFLFNLLEEFLIKKIDNLNKKEIKFKVIGNKIKLSPKIKKILLDSEKLTKNNKFVMSTVSEGAFAVSPRHCGAFSERGHPLHLPLLRF